MQHSTVKILFLGDVFGEPGRKAVKHFIPLLREQYQPDLVLANCENAAKGIGISTRLVKELLDSGVDFMTGGNHILRSPDIYPYLNSPSAKVIRPYNFSRNSPGKGVAVVESKNGVRVGLINLMGQKFMDVPVDLPFDALDRALLDVAGQSDVLVLDMHAEVTSEKRAMGWYVDGRVQLVVGTHTHVMTADDEILPNGTAYITDIGMCGPFDSVIGIDKNIILKRLRTGIPEKFEVATGDVRVNGIVCEIDLQTKKAVRITKFQEKMNGIHS